MQEVYWGLFSVDAEGIMQPASKESIQDPKEIILPKEPWKTCQGIPKAVDVLLIAQADYAKGLVVSSEEVQPVYLDKR